MYDLVVKGKIVTLDNIFDGYVGISGKKIKEIRHYPLEGDRTLNANGCLVFPGFIDIHTHLREDGSGYWDYKEDFTTGTRAAIHGGVTTVADMPNTEKNPATSVQRIREKKKLARMKAKIDVYFYAGVTSENITNLTEIADEVIGYKIFTCESTGNLLLPYEFIPFAIEKVAPTGKPISFHCEDQKTNEEAKERYLSRARGFLDYVSPELHLELRPRSSESRAIARVLSNNVKNCNICHVSTEDGLLQIMKRNEPTLTKEVTLHHIFFDREDIRLKGNLVKTNPPVRGGNDMSANRSAFKKGNIDFLVSDHAPHSEEEKKANVFKSSSGIAGLDNYGNIVAWLIKNQNVDPLVIARACSYNPARFLKLPDRGEIKVGNRADLTVIDTINPEKVTVESLYTKCKISPYVGIEFPGRVKCVIHKGEIVAEDGNVLV